MAILNVMQVGEECLTKKCKPVKTITERIRELVSDMFETMYDSGGVGLAAPQVGVLKRLFVIDVTPDPDPDQPEEEIVPEKYVMINPEILETSGEQTGYEGCLSYAGMSGLVTRPNLVRVSYTDLDGERKELTAEGLLARCILHENDHLDGIMYMTHVEGEIYTNEKLAEMLREEENSGGES